MKRNHWALWLSGLLLLAACEKDLPEGESMTAVPVIFTISNEDFGANEQVLRDAKAIKPKTVTVPLNDTYYLRATLKPDTVTDLRSDELRASLKDRQVVRFEAYTYPGGVHQSGATYTYSSGTGKLTSANPLKVEPNGTNYRFVAWSYFADYWKDDWPATENIPANRDLVCGYRDQAITNTIEGRKVGLINMEHKFSRVRIKVDASTVANSMTISDYYYSYINGGYRAKFTSMFDRTIAADSWGETGNVAFSGTSSMQESSYCVHYPAVSSVEIQSLTLSLKSGGNYVIPGLTFDFDEPLLPNTNYTLVVDIREVPYARSNIYWDGSRLWFDKTDQGNEDCQGVYFKWGSLVGISPVGGATAADVENVALYIPANISSRTWDGTKTIGTSDFGNWAGIESGGPYLYDDFSNYKGDVCKYIDGDWKIAYLRRADPLYAFPVGFEARYFGSAYGQVASGMGHMGDAGIFHNVYDTFLPVTEYRDAADGTLMGGYGIYWCDTYYGRGGLAFQGNGYINEFTPESNRGHAVRCVKADF